MTTIKMVKNKEGELILDVLGAPYGIDADNETFTARTNFLLNVGDSVPVLENHGTGQSIPTVLGKATVSKRDGKGLWFRVVLDKTIARAKELYDVAARGLLRASTGALNYLVKRTRGGELAVWPVGEISLVSLVDGQKPANHRAVAAPMLASAYGASKMATPDQWVEELQKGQKRLDEITEQPDDAQAVLRALHAMVVSSPDLEWTNDPFEFEVETDE